MTAGRAARRSRERGSYGSNRPKRSQGREPLRPRAVEVKLYARGIGSVLALGISGGSDREEFVRFSKG